MRRISIARPISKETYLYVYSPEFDIANTAVDSKLLRNGFAAVLLAQFTNEAQGHNRILAARHSIQNVLRQTQATFSGSYGPRCGMQASDLVSSECVKKMNAAEAY